MSVDGAAFDEQARRENRKLLILDTAQKVAAEFRTVIASREANPFSLRADKAAVERLDELYWHELPKIKKENEYPPDRRISVAKALAITIFHILTARDPIFLLDGDIDKKWLWRIYIHFFNTLMIDYLDVTKEHLSNSVEKKARYASFAKLASEETPPESSLYILCAYMEALCLYRSAKS